MRINLFAAVSVLGVVVAGCDAASSQTYPNQLAAWDGNEDKPGLVGWSAVPVAVPGISDRIVPENSAFDGAASFLFKAPGRKGADAARLAFESAGLTDVVVDAARECNRAAVQVLDSHADSRCHAVMVSGSKAGEAYRGVSLVLYGGSTGATEGSGVHAFMAPRGMYEALGGNAIVIGRWMRAAAAPDTNMLTIYGQLSPETTVENLDAFFVRWVTAYLVPMIGMTMQIHMQTMQSMQAWGNATMDCANYSSCDVIDLTGNGDWVSNPRFRAD